MSKLAAMVRGTVALVAIACCVVVAQPADAKLPKSRPLVVKDLVGDANGINAQGGIVPVAVPGTATPTSQRSYDIVAFSLSRLDNRKKATHLVGKVVLAAAPTGNIDIRIKMSSPECSTYFLELEWSQLGQSAYLRNNCAGGPTATFDPIDAQVKGSTVTWTVPIKALSGDVRLGTRLQVEGAQVSLATGVIFPGVDEVVTDKTYVVGQ